MNSAGASGAGVVDLERALRRFRGDRGMLRDLAEIFLSQSPVWMKQLEDAVSAADAEAIFRAAHDIKGSTEVFEASGAARAAGALERMGRQGSLEGADEALGALKAELVWVRDALREFLGE